MDQVGEGATGRGPAKHAVQGPAGATVEPLRGRHGEIIYYAKVH